MTVKRETPDQHNGRCDKVLWLDMASVKDARDQHAERIRLYCIVGHDVFVDVPRPAIPERVEVAEPAHLEVFCKRCEAPFEYTGARPKRRHYCPACINAVNQLNAVRAAISRIAVKHCAWKPCHAVITGTPGRYCSAEHRQLSNQAYARLRRERKQETLAGCYA
jgi:hypothetical protein